MTFEPTDIEAGLRSLVAGLNARTPGQRWRVASPPKRLVGAGVSGSGNVDGPGVAGTQDQDTGLDGYSASATDEHEADHASQEVA